MFDDITDVSGIEVGHAHDLEALTGCTVVLCPGGAVVGVDVRGAAPGTRETDLCRPGTLVERVHAVVLSGGSAFGLDSAGGVMQFLWERGTGFDVGVTVVPIVPAAVLFDLALGRVQWPTADDGYAACVHAARGPIAQGCVGAGTGATVGKLNGVRLATKSGIGSASIRVGAVTVGALVAVNAFGNVVLPTSGEVVAGALSGDGTSYVDMESALLEISDFESIAAQNTTIGVVATDASRNSETVSRLAVAAHDGLARTLRPVHTQVDGDTIFSLATGNAAHLSYRWSVALEVAAAEVTARAVIAAVRHATALGGLPRGRFPEST